MYKVFVTEDEAMVRDGIRNMLEDSDQFTLCGEALDGEMALPAILELKPDILLVDIEMPFMNGLDLARIVKRNLPWIGTIIVSAHDEFRYTKQAISIGIDEYLLKPMRPKTLMKTLERVVEKMEKRYESLSNGDNDRREEEKSTLRDHFLGQFVGGLISTEQFLQYADEYQISILAKCYILSEAEVKYQNEAKHSMTLRRRHIENLLKAREDIIWFFKGPERLLLIALGDEPDQVRDSIYQAVQTLQYGMKKNAQASMTIGIGTVVERLSQIKLSLEGAHTAMQFLTSIGQAGIIGINDLKEESLALSKNLENAQLEKLLRYAVDEDVMRITREFMQPHLEGGVTSMLFGYYRLMELVTAAAKLIDELGGNPTEVLGDYMSPDLMLRAAASVNETEEIVQHVIKCVISQKKNASVNKYDDVISRVKDYIHENHSNSSLSLNVVASFAGFSPNHFSTLFSSQTGMTFIEYLTRVRLENAKKMLLHDETVSEIAYQIGYRDTRYFNYSFKKYVGCTPREYREKYKP